METIADVIDIRAERARVVEVAKTWYGTHYVSRGRVKGGGCDCATLLAEVFHEAGVVPYVDVPFYPLQWALHNRTERYKILVEQFADQVLFKDPQPGDIVLYRWSNANRVSNQPISHGAIVIEWPRVIHAWLPSKQVEWGNGERGELAANTEGLWVLKRWLQ